VTEERSACYVLRRETRSLSLRRGSDEPARAKDEVVRARRGWSLDE